MAKFKDEMDNTESGKVYNKARKRYLENKALIKCSFCHYHLGENAHKLQRSWKKTRKTKYKIK